MLQPKPREDLLVSVCVTGAPVTPAEADDLRRLADTMAARFRYWELLVAIDADFEGRDALTRVSPFLRVLTLRSGCPFHRRRAAVAAEAIGDVVVLTTPGEVALFDVEAMINIALTSGAIVIGRRDRPSVFEPVVAALGRGAGFRVSSRDMRTAAYPRTELNKLLLHPDRHLALRFAPLDRGVRLRAVRPSTAHPRPRNGTMQRLRLLHRLLIACAPAVLTVMALGSLLVTVAALLFAVYAAVVWFTFEHVAPGWFTTNFMLSLTALFLGCAIFGLSIGLQKLLEVSAPDATDDIVGEVSAIDLFAKVIQEFNVELEDARAHPDAAQAGSQQ